MKIRIQHFGSACALTVFVLCILFVPKLITLQQPNLQDELYIALRVMCAIGFVVLGGCAFSEFKYYDISAEGITVSIFGIAYRRMKWDEVFDIMVGIDPLQKYSTQTLLLNCQQGKVYRPLPPSVKNYGVYEKSFYRDYYHGRILCVRCGKKLGEVLALINKYYPRKIARFDANRM